MKPARSGSALLLPIALVVASGCTTVTTESYDVVATTQIESASIATDADFSQYDRLVAEDMGIYFPSGAGTSVEDQRRIRQIFRDAFLSELADYRIVDQPGPGAMSVQASLIDFRRATGADVYALRSDYRDMAAPGSIVFLMEMRDSATGKVLARAADSAESPSIANDSSSTTDWAAVEAAAKKWARLFRTFLDENFGHR